MTQVEQRRLRNISLLIFFPNSQGDLCDLRCATCKDMQPGSWIESISAPLQLRLASAWLPLRQPTSEQMLVCDPRPKRESRPRKPILDVMLPKLQRPN